MSRLNLLGLGGSATSLFWYIDSFSNTTTMEHHAREATADDYPALVDLIYRGLNASKVVLDVRKEWDWLWRTGRFMAVCVEDVKVQKVVALMGAVLITERYFRILASDPNPYCNRRLGRAPQIGDHPLPPIDRLLDGTATLLINYFAWSTDLAIDEASILRGHLANAYLDFHGGYPIRRIALEVIGEEMRELSQRTGSIVVNDHAEWARAENVPARERAYLLAIDRGQALQTENHWYSRAFRYQPPRLGLSLRQREMLRLAREGLTDRQIADRLSLSTDALKKRWESIYARFYSQIPGVLSPSSDGKRGAEKRRIVLAHLHERQEELRP